MYERHPERNDSHFVETIYLREDVVQIEAGYHDKCRIRFFQPVCRRSFR